MNAFFLRPLLPPVPTSLKTGNPQPKAGNWKRMPLPALFFAAAVAAEKKSPAPISA